MKFDKINEVPILNIFLFLSEFCFHWFLVMQQKEMHFFLPTALPASFHKWKVMLPQPHTLEGEW